MIDCQASCDACRLLETEGQWRVQLHTGDESLDRLQSEWDLLLARSDSTSLFSQSAWQRLWWRHFGSDFVLRIITLRDGSGRLAGIAPLMAPRYEPESTLTFIGGTEVADYLDLIVDRNRAAEARTALLDAIQRHLRWDTLDLHCLPEHSCTPTAMAESMQGKGIVVRQEQEDVCPLVELHGSWDGYLAHLSKKDRHELRRKLRRAVDDLGASWRTVETAADLEPTVEAFIQLHRSSSPAKAAFMTEAMAAYFRELAAVSHTHGWLRMGVLWAGETAVSSAMGFVFGDRFYLYNSGYDPAYGVHSVGIAAVGLLVREAAQEGLAIFDFLQGNESYKYTLGAQDRPVYRVLATREEQANE